MFITYILIALISFIVLIEVVKFMMRRLLGVPKIKLKPFQFYRVNDKHGEITIWIKIASGFLLLISSAFITSFSIPLLYSFIIIIITGGIVGLLTTAHFEYWHSDTPRRAFVTLSEAGIILLAGVLFFVFNIPELLQNLNN